MKQQIQPALFTIDSGAAYLGVSKRVMELYIEAEKLHTYRLPSPKVEGEFLRKTLIEREELDRLKDQGMRV